jgi:hypothetical protein
MGSSSNHLITLLLCCNKVVGIGQQYDLDNNEIVDNKGIVIKMVLLAGYREKLRVSSAAARLSL